MKAKIQMTEHNRVMLDLAEFMVQYEPKPGESIVHIYETWRSRSGIIIKNAQEVELILKYIAQVRDFDKEVLKGMIAYDKERFVGEDMTPM